ncbi:MAG: transcriptional regulator, TetR family [Bryobacterales bacterium]|nr:transcriptional regulator, TetR family [Bryobacterales bacterium]
MTNPSDVPVREPGTRARSGNAMGRTRSALLGATAECVARYGIRKTTMVDVASKSGVAKATLYNHFRTKDDVLSAVVDQQVADLVGACVTTASSAGLAEALAHVAAVLGEHPALRKAADGEQQLLAPLLTPSASRGWQLAREGVAAVLTAGGAPSSPSDVDTVLRWATSQVLWPLTRDEARSAAEALVRGLTTRTAPAPAPAAAATTSNGALGWPG